MRFVWLNARALVPAPSKREMLGFGLRGDVDRLLATAHDDGVLEAARALLRVLNA